MDRLIKHFEAEPDEDLMLCAHRGVAYQRDMSKGRKAYDRKYLENYDAYAVGPIGAVLNAARIAMLRRHVAAPSRVLDIGAASGIFVQRAMDAGYEAKGFDIIPEAVERLKDKQAFSDSATEFSALTMWDSMEHMEVPEVWLGSVNKGAVMLVAVPVFEDLKRIRDSKHYKPGEHLYYFTAQGFVDWMALYGYRLMEESDHEIKCGRESIGAFAFCRDLPDHQDFINAYKEMHATRFYGSSATELHFTTAFRIVRMIKPHSILDYGCGRSDLVAHFWCDGARRIARYDPAVRQYRRMPEGKFDLVLCCDVMEHIPMGSVGRILEEVRSKGAHAFFTISTKPARARLPDGTNAHVTLLSKNEWVRWIKQVFGKVEVFPADSESELVLLAGARS